MSNSPCLNYQVYYLALKYSDLVNNGVLPEVERATRLLNEFGAGKVIVKVETKEDVLVYSGITHTDFVSSDSSSLDMTHTKT